jgi:hypothetical protein
MSYLITFLIGALLGFLGGLLTWRKNAARFTEAEAKARAAAGLLKK